MTHTNESPEFPGRFNYPQLDDLQTERFLELHRPFIYKSIGDGSFLIFILYLILTDIYLLQLNICVLENPSEMEAGGFFYVCNPIPTPTSELSYTA